MTGPGSPGRPGGKLSVFTGLSPAVQVVGYIATRPGDAERGPLVRLRADDALIRLVTPGDLVRVVSERRSEIAVLEIDDSLPRGGCVLRDVLGASLSEIVRIVKVDTHSRPRV